MNTCFDIASITRIIRSMASGPVKGGPIPFAPALLDALPPDARQRLARDIVCFFGVDAAEAPALTRQGDYPAWAAFLHERITAAPSCSITFFTSGSTGQPRPHTFTLDALFEEADALKVFFADRKRVVSIMPVHHVFGFAFALILPKALGVPVVDMAPLPSATFFRALRAGDLVLAFPVFWQSLLNICSGPYAVVCPPGVHGISSTAPCPSETIENLLSVFGRRAAPILAGMTEIYGATEFGAIGIRKQCRAPYALLPHWRRTPIAVGEDADSAWGICREHGDGMPLPDIVTWQDERRFVLLRRRDNAVQVGGINVFPLRIAGLLREHPKVRECAVRLMRPEEGVRLKAFVVPARDALPGGALAKELKLWMASRLEPASVPKSITFGDSLPVTRSGKLADWTISTRCTDAPGGCDAP